MAVAEPTQPAARTVVTHFIVSDDVDRSRRFYTDVLGGTVVFGPEPTNVALAEQLHHYQRRRRPHRRQAHDHP